MFLSPHLLAAASLWEATCPALYRLLLKDGQLNFFHLKSYFSQPFLPSNWGMKSFGIRRCCPFSCGSKTNWVSLSSRVFLTGQANQKESFRPWISRVPKATSSSIMCRKLLKKLLILLLKTSAPPSMMPYIKRKRGVENDAGSRRKVEKLSKDAWIIIWCSFCENSAWHDFNN